MGYHKREIAKGVYGELSKLEEEIEELKDAIEQDCYILQLNELADIWLAFLGFVRKKYPKISINDIAHMAQLTESAFNDGTRV